ncbi:MAG: TRAP transporter substrate-binding protein [Rhodospirillales bacterium]|nr:TRAP transporter substrate-binding protein [Rhodospirillales bacterium]
MRGMKFLTAVAAATLLGASAGAADIDSTKLTYVGSWSGLVLFKQFEKPFWSETLPKASGGKIEVEVSTFDQMGLKGAEVYRLLAKNVFDIGATVADYTVQDAPELEGLDIPMMASDPKLAQAAAMAYKPVVDDIMAKRFDAKVLAIVPYPAQVLFCNKPIKGLADIKGLKVRASGRSTAEFLTAAGAEGITMAFSEVPGALQRGVIDCAVTGSLSGYSAGWGEVAKVLYPLPIGGWDHVVTAISLKKWNSLGKATQQFLLAEVVEKLENQVWKAAEDDSEQGIACLSGKGKVACKHGKPGSMTIVEPTAEEMARARKLLLEKSLPAWASRVEDEWVKRWNDTIGKTVDLIAKK